MERTSAACGLKHCKVLVPRMSYSTHDESSCPLTSNRPDGSTQTAATGEPCCKSRQFEITYFQYLTSFNRKKINIIQQWRTQEAHGD